MEIISLFCEVDDFCKTYKVRKTTEAFSPTQTPRRNRQGCLSKSEIMTLLIYFHHSHYRNFKYYYLNLVCTTLKQYFPHLISYSRFVAICKNVMIELCVFLSSRLEPCSGISFIDSTKLAVCHTKRISRNKVFKETAAIGKTTMGWFFGFKLHLIINDQGGLVAVKVTSGNTDDRAPVPEMVKNVFGKMFGDKGYISKALFESLFKNGITFITGLKKGMKNKFMPILDKILLRKRSIIETVNDQLKNISQIDHTRHRSGINFMVNLVCGLLAYTFMDKKPSIRGVWRENNDSGIENILLIQN